MGFVGVNRFVTWKQVNAVSVLEYREEEKIGLNNNFLKNKNKNVAVWSFDFCKRNFKKKFGFV